MYLNNSLSAGLLALLHSSGKVDLKLTPSDYLTIGHGNFELDANKFTQQFHKQLNTSVPKLVVTKENIQSENLHQEEPPTG